MADEEHGHKRAGHAQRGLRAEHGHADLVHQEAGDNRRDALRGHAGRVVEAGVAADIAAGAHLNDHREGVDVDGRPADTGEAEHQPFESIEKAIHEDEDIESSSERIYTAPRRILIGDTDEGQRKRTEIDDLEALTEAYGNGLIREKME